MPSTCQDTTEESQDLVERVFETRRYIGEGWREWRWNEVLVDVNLFCLWRSTVFLVVGDVTMRQGHGKVGGLGGLSLLLGGRER